MPTDKPRRMRRLSFDLQSSAAQGPDSNYRAGGRPGSPQGAIRFACCCLLQCSFVSVHWCLDCAACLICWPSPVRDPGPRPFGSGLSFSQELRGGEPPEGDAGRVIDLRTHRVVPRANCRPGAECFLSSPAGVERRLVLPVLSPA
jgi:hypothetical protein